MQLALLLLLLVGTCRADDFFGALKDWFDKITAPNEYCNRKWITLDGKGDGKGRIKH